jgi:hypothetical protein
MKDNIFEVFVNRCRTEQDQLRDELQSYPTLGIIRVWKGRSVDHLLDVTDERIATIKHEIARIEATIEFVIALENAL